MGCSRHNHFPQEDGAGPSCSVQVKTHKLKGKAFFDSALEVAGLPPLDQILIGTCMYIQTYIHICIHAYVVSRPLSPSILLCHSNSVFP